MSVEMRRQLFNLANLSLNELRAKWYDIFKSDPPYHKRRLLIRELAYQIQSLYYTNIPSKNEIANLIKIAEKEIIDKNDKVKYASGNRITIVPPIGTVIKKIYRNQEYFIKILEDNKIEYNGDIYKSLSAVAYKITGTKWNGKVFFGLVKDRKDLENNNLNIQSKKVG